MEGKGCILVVDDEPQFAGVIELMLRQEGFDVDLAHDGLDGLRKAFDRKPDIILLDIMMPRMDGWELCRRLRDVSEVPIIVISARGREADIVRALELGADDYLVKPFGATELIARVYALMRRTGFRQSAVARPLTFGNVVVDLKRHRVSKNGQEVGLTPTEFRLLSTLVRAAGRVLPHRYLLTEIWGSDYADQLQYLRLYVRYLREKLEDDPTNPKLIITEWGIGYRLRAPDD
ncbi:MAG: response regulator transcription factor [Anaerolineae bacterium]|nr:response regulator transcription factor [Anaerolineae bacterium]